MSESQMMKIEITSTGAAQTVPVPMGFDYLKLINKTVAQTNNPVGPLFVGAEWDPSMAAGSALFYRKLNGANTIENPPLTSGGFTIINDANPGTNAAFTLANPAFTAADPSIWETTADHGYVAGNIVRVYNTTAARQYASLDLSVIDTTTTKKFTTLLDTTGITQATAGNVRKLNLDTSLYYPRRRYIAKITKGTSTVVRVTVVHDFKVGEYVRFIVPSVFGMSQLDGLRGKVTAINTTVSPFTAATSNTITVDIDSSSFSNFAFPASASVPFTFAQVVPDGEFPQFLTAAQLNVGVYGVQLGASICGALNDAMVLYAWKADQTDSQ